ncbi:MAG: [protein-PII] uridylyltransferase [Corynebacterium sp.]|nr:[protein-PII] uridylyltransferase [Corynebacterium sp.]
MDISPQNLQSQASAKVQEVLASLELPDTVALCATGSLAREEMTTYSDLDLLLLTPEGFDVSSVENLWYPIWDSKIRLDAAVRTPQECVAMLGEDPTAALALLDLRFLRGDEALYQQTYQRVLRRWRREVPKQFNTLNDLAIARWRRSGSVVDMTRPDIKNGRGGLRDYDFIRALALANVCDVPDLKEQHQLLVDTRALLHYHARRNRDLLDPEFAVDIAIDLGYADRYELARAVTSAARSIDQALTQALQTARNVLPKKRRFRSPIRRPLDIDVVEIDGEIALSREPNLEDASLVLRVAAASARTGLPIASYVWPQLAKLPELTQPWQRNVAQDFFALLSSATHTPGIVASLDEHGFWKQYVPEWEHIREFMPHEPSHVHTVAQHSLVVTSLCAAQAVRVARPDLLLLAALYHDMGKGYGRPHAEVGAEFVAEMAKRLRLSAADRAIVTTVVAEHTTIPQLVSTRDYTDPATVDILLDRIRYNALTLNLLEVLAECDAQGTGPGVWTRGLARGVEYLCRTARQRLDIQEPAAPVVPAGEQIGLWPEDTASVMEQPTNPNVTEITAPTAIVHFEGETIASLQQPLAVIAAKGWNIEGAQIVVEHASVTDASVDVPVVDDAAATAHDQPVTTMVRANFRVYNLLGSGFSAVDFIQSYKSGVYTELPQVPGAMVGTLWRDDFVEIRVSDQRASLGTLLSVLPAVRWVRARTVGATMIAQCKLEPNFDRVQVERAIVRALGDGAVIAGH